MIPTVVFPPLTGYTPGEMGRRSKIASYAVAYVAAYDATYGSAPIFGHEELSNLGNGSSDTDAPPREFPDYLRLVPTE